MIEKNLNDIALGIYNIISGYQPMLADENTVKITEKKKYQEARFFEFNYSENDKKLGDIILTLDDDGLEIDVGSIDISKRTPKLIKLLTHLRKYCGERLLNSDITNSIKDENQKRDYYNSRLNKDEMMENKLFGTSKISYQNLGETRMVIKHKSPIDDNKRYINIESIYLENNQGERFKYPYKHLQGARALAEHLNSGGNPYDSIGKYITNLSEELAQLRKFKGYVSRQPMISESMNDISSSVIERMDTIKKEINSLQRPSYYKQFSESFKEKSFKNIPESVKNDWIERLTVKTFNEDLTKVFPYLYNLIDESSLPILEISADKLLNDKKKCKKCHEVKCICNNTKPKDISEEFEQYINEFSLDEDIMSDDLQSRSEEIKHINEILQNEIQVGINGENAINTFKDLLDIPEFYNSLKNIDPELDVRPLLQDYLLEHHPEIEAELDFSDDEGNHDGSELKIPEEPINNEEPEQNNSSEEKIKENDELGDIMKLFGKL